MKRTSRSAMSTLLKSDDIHDDVKALLQCYLKKGHDWTFDHVSISLRHEEGLTTCRGCEKSFFIEENTFGEPYCRKCFGQMDYCNCCEELHWISDLTEVEGEDVCKKCLKKETELCDWCHEVFFIDSLNETGHCGAFACHDCVAEVFNTCDHCQQLVHVDELQKTGDKELCPSCEEELVECCVHCGENFFQEDLIADGEFWRCGGCLEELQEDEDDCGPSYALEDEFFARSTRRRRSA